MYVDEDGVMQEGVYMRTPYTYDRKKASDAIGMECTEPSLAQQQFAEECDINTIVRRFGLTGELPKDLVVPQSGDFTEVVDYHTAMNIVRKADESFMEMPAEVRSKFNNDPQRFLEFVYDPTNQDEARKLGIAKAAPQAAKPVEVRVIPDKAA